MLSKIYFQTQTGEFYGEYMCVNGRVSIATNQSLSPMRLHLNLKAYQLFIKGTEI